MDTTSPTNLASSGVSSTASGRIRGWTFSLRLLFSRAGIKPTFGRKCPEKLTLDTHHSALDFLDDSPKAGDQSGNRCFVWPSRPRILLRHGHAHSPVAGDLAVCG